MSKKQWHYEKNHTTFKKAYAAERKIYKSKWKAFWEAMDEVCEGNIVYDFWWWFIWQGFIKPTFDIPKKIRAKRKFNRQRIKLGVAETDIWGWDEFILEYFDHGFTMFVKQIWGSDVESWDDKRWKEWNHDTYNRKFYNKIVDFQKNMQGLRDVRYELDNLKYPENHKLGDPLPDDYSRALFELNNMETLALESAWKNLLYILTKYHWNLWT